MRADRKKLKDNRGFTLVEMIVTVAITAIFSAVVLTAVTADSRLYRSVSGTARVQMDTQQLSDALETWIVNANRSIYYESGEKTLLLCSQQKNADGTSSRIVDILKWDQKEESLYYSQKQLGTDNSETILTEPSVYADGIKEFRVDVSEAVSGGIVRFYLTTEEQGKEIRTQHTVNLRNPVKIMLPETEQQDEGGQSQT